MTPRRILLVNWNDRTNPWGGGAEIHLHELFGRLAARGHRVTLLCSGYPGADSRTELDGMEVLRVGGRYTYNFVVPGALRRLQREREFDVVVEALNKIPLCTPVYSRTPVVGIGHHLFGTTIFREVPPPMSLYVYLSELAVPWVYRDTPMEVISASTADDFAARGLSPDRIRVVYVGIDRDQYRPSPEDPKESAPTFLALGRVRRYKRLDLVIDAVARLAPEFPDVRLVVAGSGNWLDPLRKHAERIGAGDHVVFEGRVDESRKVSLYRRAWALVMTSPKEGWGLTCLEAQACGTPVIASDSPGLREAVRHGQGGLLVPHADREELTTAMRRMIADEGERERLRQGALAFADEFSWDRAAAETAAILEAAIAGGRRA
ncbi:MAG: glycosyltransferase family 4 protein [Gemmatimonadetes bacterium]|nr:glycosyltransferase family 4 protein [Gemmatimonadota bacterium]